MTRCSYGNPVFILFIAKKAGYQLPEGQVTAKYMNNENIVDETGFPF